MKVQDVAQYPSYQSSPGIYKIVYIGKACTCRGTPRIWINDEIVVTEYFSDQADAVLRYGELLKNRYMSPLEEGHFEDKKTTDYTIYTYYNIRLYKCTYSELVLDSERE